MNIPATNLPRIVILGGGFAGLKLALSIKSKLAQVVLIDKNNYHTFQPLMYQVATAGLEPDSIAYPIRKVFRNKRNFYFRWATVTSIDVVNKQIDTSIGKIGYDYLVIATGAVTNYFGNKSLEENSVPMKSLTEALDIRSMVLQNFEQALNVTDENERKALLNVVIAGAGPTGVELAGAFAELRRHILAKDYPDLDISKMQIHLIEAAPRVLAAMSNNASVKAEKSLLGMGIVIHKNVRVESYDGFSLHAGELKLQTRTLIWAAGVKGAPVEGLPTARIKGGRIEVNEFNGINEIDNVFAIGDVAVQASEKFPAGYPMLASVANQQGKQLGRNFNRLLRGKKMETFTYKDKGTMATIGRNSAVVDLSFWKFSGFFAWLVWMFVHLMLLVSFRNRVVVLVNWMWSYFSYDKGTRLIIRKFKKSKN
ncbi:MAG: NAD(P)/FAD-dependent oxidoreductase [Flavobacteriales bacterium]